MKFRFGVAALATWRLTHLLVREDGPADAIARTREWLGESQLGALMDCFYCTSFWVAVAVVSTVMRSRRPAPLQWLAVSGGACLLERITRRDIQDEELHPNTEETERL